MKINIFAILALFLLVGCGGEEAATESKAPAKTEKPAAPEKKAEDVRITLLSGDDMKFNKKELRAYAGKEVTLTLKHTGSMDAASMGHNFVLLKEGTDAADFALRAMDARDTDYIPEGEEVIAHTKTIGGGEKTTIIFTAPAAGTYDFLCSFPGHFSLMRGKLIVE